MKRLSWRALAMFAVAAGISVPVTRAQTPNQPGAGSQPSVANEVPAELLEKLAAARTAPSSGVRELPPFDKVTEGYTQVATGDPQRPQGLVTLYKRDADNQLLMELPKDFAGKRYFVALTVSAGERYAGLQAGDLIVEWRELNDRLALIIPQLEYRAPGEKEAQDSVKRLFTDSVILDVPILTRRPNGGPVIDADELFAGSAGTFFGGQVVSTKPALATIASAKSFPENAEIAFQIVGGNNQLQVIHYSLSQVPQANNGFKPREADERIGYFTTAYTDLSKYDDDDTRVRFINRWHLEKRDPRLKLSPPKNPIRFYLEHTTPVRYRRWVKQGVDYWNKAFEKVGFVDAIVIEYQDAETGAHMEKDPEDVRYNFIRWLNNDIGTAIGPSRVHPETGQILDADIVLTDGWIRHFKFNYEELMPQLAMEGTTPETLAWLNNHPNWDPRVRMAAPSDQLNMHEQIGRQARQPMSGHPLGAADSRMIGDQPFDGLYGRLSQVNGYCMAGNAKRLDLAIARMGLDAAMLMQDGEPQPAPAEGEKKDEEKKDEEKKEEPKADQPKEEKGDMLDGIPDWFIGPLLSELVAHEVGHTLGLRHNFKASAHYTLSQINSDAVKGKSTLTGSVMDYIPINFRLDAGDQQGDYTMISIGPYDYWAIEYGYTLEDNALPEILKRCNQPELQYATDEDTIGPDPLARRYDFSQDPLDYAVEQMKLVNVYRGRLLEKFVKDGDSWSKARQGYETTLGLQARAVGMMSGWIGGAFVNRDKKGDPGDRQPVTPVPAEQQRRALQFVVDNMFVDSAFGMTPELLNRLSDDRWLDQGFGSSEPAWPIHDRILGLQSSALTQLLNPTTLRRVYDNELRLAADQDALTLPELLDKVRDSVWTELGQGCPTDASARKPAISSLRRNLQREHLERLFDLTLATDTGSAASKPITTLATAQLKGLKAQIDNAIATCGDKLDPYSKAHLADAQTRIDRVLTAEYTANPSSGGAGGPIILMLGQDKPAAK
jgi:hypothetical protein